MAAELRLIGSIRSRVFEKPSWFVRQDVCVQRRGEEGGEASECSRCLAGARGMWGSRGRKPCLSWIAKCSWRWGWSEAHGISKSAVNSQSFFRLWEMLAKHLFVDEKQKKQTLIDHRIKSSCQKNKLYFCQMLQKTVIYYWLKKS